MATECNLIVDSCCDLPASMLQVDGVSLINFSYSIDGTEYLDDMFESITPREFYDSMRNGADPKTAQLSIQLLTSVFEEAARKDKPTLFLCFSSGLSGTFDTASMVAQTVSEAHPGSDIRVYDTRLASTAEALLIYDAIKRQQAGASIDELVSWVEEAVPSLKCLFMVEDLETLRRGGRIPGGVAAVGSKLDVKPMLSIAEDGTLGMAGLARGRKKGIKQLVSLFLKNVPEESRAGKTLAIGHADCLEDAERLKDLLVKVDPDMEYLVCNVGPVIGSHVGPGMLAFVFWAK